MSVDARPASVDARSAAMSAGKADKAGEDGAAGGAEAGRSDKPACNLFVAHVRPRGGRDDVGWSSTGQWKWLEKNRRREAQKEDTIQNALIEVPI